MRYSSIVVALIAPAATLLAQNPGQNVRVDVTVSSVSVTADTTGISYQVANLVTSTEPLWVFNIDVPGGVLRVATSTGPVRWLSGTNFRSRPMAGWMFLDDITPGSTTPTLRFDAAGLPGIVSYWAGGYFPIPPAEDELVTDSTVLPDPFVTRMILGETIGVDPWPTIRTAQALLARLRALTQRSCSAPATWITDASQCGQLVTELDQAETYRANGQFTQARDVLGTYQALVSSGSTSGTIKNPAYWLLKSNAEIVRAIM